jgi:uncharacterized protein (DUF2236 family)
MMKYSEKPRDDFLTPYNERIYIHTKRRGLPLGPDSLLWKYFDCRMSLVPATGIKKLMLRDIDAGVEQHSQFFDEIIERTYRSMKLIGRTVFDIDQGAAVGKSIRDNHFNIKGVNSVGEKYHALNPKLWADTHITFADAVYQVADRFDGNGLNDVEREILWLEMMTWYQQYGVSDRYLPRNYTEYKKRSDEMENEYVLTSTAKRALEYAIKGTIPRPNALPASLWSLLKAPLRPTAHFLGAIVISGLPESVREKHKNEISYSDTDKLLVGALEDTMKLIEWEKVPGWVRYPDDAYQAFRREGRYKGLSDEMYAIGSTAIKSSVGVIDGVMENAGFVTKKLCDAFRVYK